MQILITKMFNVNFLLFSLCCFVACFRSALADRVLFFVLADKGESCREGCMTRQANCDMTDLTTLAEEEIMSAFKVLVDGCTQATELMYAFNHGEIRHGSVPYACVPYLMASKLKMDEKSDKHLNFGKHQVLHPCKQKLEVKCVYDDRPWWEFNQPSVVVDPFDDNFGRCLGWRGKPEYHDCAARWPSVRRLCQCAKDITCANRRF